eukprot:TRINITY_DN37864_c0_g1_i1.p1 TRINITY_DN37864_c0_g1~~TRINITY_DN37864_c0_g1_i1.p1  ORF type:complete len:232 (+),score=31.75 TRINITY_DN37864_c0_g1_i1:42-737(+)
MNRLVLLAIMAELCSAGSVGEVLEGVWQVAQWDPAQLNEESEEKRSIEVTTGSLVLNKTQYDSVLLGGLTFGEESPLRVKAESVLKKASLVFTTDSTEAPWLVLDIRPEPFNSLKLSVTTYTSTFAASGRAVVVFFSDTSFYVTLSPDEGSLGKSRSFWFRREPEADSIMDNWRLYLCAGLGFIFARYFMASITGRGNVKQWQASRASALNQSKKARKVRDTMLEPLKRKS